MKAFTWTLFFGLVCLVATGCSDSTSTGSDKAAVRSKDTGLSETEKAKFAEEERARERVEAEMIKKAILAILKEDDRIGKAMQGKIGEDATPSQVAQAINSSCSQAEALDLSKCPAEFRVAYKQHLRAWRDAQAAVQQLPDGFLEGVFMGAMNSLLRDESDGGQKRLEGDLKRAIERVRTSWEEVEKSGAKYGAAL
jgi:hypothetical protein